CAWLRRAPPRPTDTNPRGCPGAAAGTGWFLSRVGSASHDANPTSARGTAARQIDEAEDERATEEDDGAAGQASRGDRLAQEQHAPDHPEDRNEERHRDRLHRPHVGDEAVVEDER